MLTASESRSKSRNDRVIFDEIRDIESAILDAVETGDYETTLDDTLMTDAGAGIAVARQYYATWTAVDQDRKRSTQMNSVIDYFTSLGYSIERRLNATTGDTFIWYVAW